MDRTKIDTESREKFDEAVKLFSIRLTEAAIIFKGSGIMFPLSINMNNVVWRFDPSRRDHECFLVADGFDEEPRAAITLVVGPIQGAIANAPAALEGLYAKGLRIRNEVTADLFAAARELELLGSPHAA
jgi:hypothetical protein